MRPTSCFVLLLAVALIAAASNDDKLLPDTAAVAKTVIDKVASSNGPWTRVTGKAKVLGPYTLRFEDGTEVDLRFAIDAPEPDQMAAIGQSLYPWGQQTAEFLARLIDGKDVAFFTDGNIVRGKTPHGPCYVGETHLQTEMVRHGWAVSGHSGMDAWEIIARQNKRGLWRGEFVPPKKWRQGERLPQEK